MNAVKVRSLVALLACLPFYSMAQSTEVETGKTEKKVRWGIRTDVLDMSAVLPGLDGKFGKHAIYAGAVTLPFSKYVVNRLTGFYISYQYYFMEKTRLKQYVFAGFMANDYAMQLEYWQYDPNTVNNQMGGEMPARAMQTEYIQKLNGTIGYGIELGFGKHFYFNASIGAGATNRKATIHSELLEPANFGVPDDRHYNHTSMEGQLKLGVGWRL